MSATAPARRLHRAGPGLAPAALGHLAVLPHPAPDGWTPGPEGDAPLPDAARERFTSLGDDLRTSVRKVRRGLDADDVHDLRVAARRLEVTVGEFAGVLDVRDRRTLVAELERLSKRLGAVTWTCCSTTCQAMDSPMRPPCVGPGRGSGPGLANAS